MKMPIPLGPVIRRIFESGVPRPSPLDLGYTKDFHRTVRELYAGKLLIVRRDTSVNPPNINVTLV